MIFARHVHTRSTVKKEDKMSLLIILNISRVLANIQVQNCMGTEQVVKTRLVDYFVALGCFIRNTRSEQVGENSDKCDLDIRIWHYLSALS